MPVVCSKLEKLARDDGYNLTRFVSPEPVLIFTYRKSYIGYSPPPHPLMIGVPGAKHLRAQFVYSIFNATV